MFQVATRIAKGALCISCFEKLTLNDPEAVDFCQCYMNSGAMPELVFEQRGDVRTVVHPEHFRCLKQESNL